MAAGLKTAAEGMYYRTPPKRKRTRRAVTTSQDGSSGDVGIVFASGHRYPTDGTETKTIAENAWRQSERQTWNEITETLLEELDI